MPKGYSSIRSALLLSNRRHTLKMLKMPPWMQYNASLVITGAIRDTSTNKTLAVTLKHFSDRRISERLTLFLKIKNYMIPKY